jgi:hypothetical protein
VIHDAFAGVTVGGEDQEVLAAAGRRHLAVKHDPITQALEPLGVQLHVLRSCRIGSDRPSRSGVPDVAPVLARHDPFDSRRARLVLLPAVEEAHEAHVGRKQDQLLDLGMRQAIERDEHHDQRRAILQELLRDGFGLTVEEITLERNVRGSEDARADRFALRLACLGGQARPKPRTRRPGA